MYYFAILAFRPKAEISIPIKAPNAAGAIHSNPTLANGNVSMNALNCGKGTPTCNNALTMPVKAVKTIEMG